MAFLTRRKAPATAFLFAAAAAALLVAQAAWAVAATSATFDEPLYLELGREAFYHRDFSRFADFGVAPLPVLLSYALPAHRPDSPLPQAINLARASSIVLFGIPLVLIAYFWLEREVGWRAGAAAALLVALSPNIVAHASLATTDIAFLVCALIALAALSRYVRGRSTRSLAALALALGAALSAKYSAVGLFAVVFVVLLVTPTGTAGARRSTLSRLSEACALTALLVTAAFLTSWALHGFSMVTSGFDEIGTMRMPAPLAGLIFQIKHQRGGHHAFLLGMRAGTGWWYYMPVALLLKSTPAELLVLAASLAVLLVGWRDATPSALVWRIAFLVFGGLSLVSRVDAGVRYVLLLIPLAVFVTIDYLYRTMAGARMRLSAGLVAIVCIQALSAALIAPHYLSYFNRMFGGPSEGYRYLADSNVDWGQDLPALRETLARVGAKRPLLSYFGSAPPEAYGVHATPWLAGSQSSPESFDWIAISATNLDGVYLTDDPFAPFRDVSPSARAAYSLLLYATDRPDVQRAMAATSARLLR